MTLQLLFIVPGFSLSLSLSLVFFFLRDKREMKYDRYDYLLYALHLDARSATSRNEKSLATEIRVPVPLSTCATRNRYARYSSFRTIISVCTDVRRFEGQFAACRSEATLIILSGVANALKAVPRSSQSRSFHQAGSCGPPHNFSKKKKEKGKKKEKR